MSIVRDKEKFKFYTDFKQTLAVATNVHGRIIKLINIIEMNRSIQEWDALSTILSNFILERALWKFSKRIPKHKLRQVCVSSSYSYLKSNKEAVY